ncbi:MAG TPA: hypothetical protein VGS22_11620 [Thermoanaerobaculia bacterium]|nr:hypothetical protein [Thermoanaerobaculia bacterium]
MPPHDHLFKSLFRAFFRDLLLLLDAQLAAWLPAGAEVEFRDKELIPDSPQEEHRTVDLLGAIPDPVGGCQFLVHVEIERKAGKEIGRRLWDYSIRLRGHYPEASISLVVFLRGGPPGAVWQTHVEETAGLEVARFRYLSFGLSRLPAEHLLARPEPLAWGLAALARPGALGRARVKFEALKKIANAHIGEHHRLLLLNCVETYLPLKGRDAEEYASLASARRSPEMKAMQMTWADRIEAKGVEKGLSTGLEKGRKQGLKLGLEKGIEQGSLAAADRLRRTVVRLLRQRFGRVPAPLRKRLAAIRTVDELGAIADRIFEVQSIDELAK